MYQNVLGIFVPCRDRDTNMKELGITSLLFLTVLFGLVFFLPPPMFYSLLQLRLLTTT